MRMARAALLAVLLTAHQAAGSSPREATDEILRLLPAECAAALIVEDFAGHCADWSGSPLGKRFLASSLAAEWRSSAPFQKMHALEGALQSFTGCSLPELRDDVLGSSVVLAFWPGRGPGTDVGLLFCRAPKQSALDKLIRNVAPWGGAVVEGRRHHNVEYLKRTDPNGKVSYLLRLGATAVLTDKEDALQAVVATSEGGPQVAERPDFAAMRSAVPGGALLTLLVNPRPLDVRWEKSSAKGVDAALGRRFGQVWKSLRWVALTLHVRSNVELACHWELDASKLPAEWRAKTLPLDVGTEPIDSLDHTLLKAGWSSDISRLGRFVGGVVAEEGAPRETAQIQSIARQLLFGRDPSLELIAALGPRFCLAVAAGEGVLPEALVAVELREPAPDPAGRPKLTDAVEQALRFALIILGAELNKERSDGWEAAFKAVDRVHIHFLQGSRYAPSEFQPGFAVFDGWLIFGSSPAIIARAATGPRNSSRLGSEIVRMDLAATRTFLEHRRVPLQSYAAAATIDRILAAMDLFDGATIKVETTAKAHHCSLRLIDARSR